MLRAIADAVRGGMPTLAECGGFMYLHKQIADPDGTVYPMAGVVDGVCNYTGHSVRFGYMQILEACSCKGFVNRAGGEAEKLLSDKPVSVHSTTEKTGAWPPARFLPFLPGMRGHEFHYYESSCSGQDCIAAKPSGERTWRCMTVTDHSVWGFPHLYYGSSPGFAEAFADTVRQYASAAGKLK